MIAWIICIAVLFYGILAMYYAAYGVKPTILRGNFINFKSVEELKAENAVNDLEREAEAAVNDLFREVLK